MKAGKKKHTAPQSQPPALAAVSFPLLFGLFLGLVLLKFGNPPIFEEMVSAPEDLYQFVLGFPWPMTWSYAALIALTAIGLYLNRSGALADAQLRLGNLRRDHLLCRVLVLPLAWFGWQMLAATGSIAPKLTWAVLPHFIATLACFYLGFFVLGAARRSHLFWLALLVCFWFVLITGWSQQFGGLEQTRKYFYLYIYPQLKDVSPDYLKKIASDRIFGTLFYPNALAGAVILLLPPLLIAIMRLKQQLTFAARLFLAAATVIGALGCLVWSGSKGGWLIMLVLVLAALLRFPFDRRIKMALLLVVFLGGAAGFVWRYAGFFQKGATSVSARFDYWQAAARITASHPGLGTGPGTFGIAYGKIKRPQSEPSRLTHNDYLEQAADSGVIGMLLYSGFMVTALIAAFPRIYRAAAPASAPLLWAESEDWQLFAVWLGVLGWALQGFMEFGLYIPALAWPAFSLLGWLLAHRVGKLEVERV